MQARRIVSPPHPRCVCALLAGLALAACSGDPGDAGTPPEATPALVAAAQKGAPGADWKLVERTRRDRAEPRHASDGGGRAWIERGAGEPEQAVSRVPASHRIVYEVGPDGIARDGAVFFQVSPFWSWSRPQTDEPGAPGYTRVEASASDAELEVRARNPKALLIRNVGRPLAAGERIVITYGAGAAGAVALNAEKEGRLWIAVDGDGDGTPAYLTESPRLDVLPGPPERLIVTLPATAHPGEAVHLTVAAVDAELNAVEDFVGEIAFPDPPEGLDLPPRIAISRDDRGCARVRAVARAAGVVRVLAEGADGLSGRSNPMEISATQPRILWGDLHGHSAFSDGTGRPQDYFRYARDVAGLDVVALTDHDYWGVVPLDRNPQHWREIQEQTLRFHVPERFVTLLGFEWTNWAHGHRHVLYFEDRGEVISAIDPETDTPPRLWRALAGRSALTFAHHSAGGPMATNWDFPPDPDFEPVTEIASQVGSSEAPDTPRPVANAAPGNFVRDALDRGYQLGFIGSGDSHDGHPGSVHHGRPPGGLAAILSEELTRDGVLAALRARRTYATNGPRILLRVELDSRPMGADVAVRATGALTAELDVRVTAPRSLERVDVVRSGRLAESVPGRGALELSFGRTLDALRPGEYVYVRAVQRNGGAAWSSPFFIGSD